MTYKINDCGDNSNKNFYQGDYGNNNDLNSWHINLMTEEITIIMLL